MQFPTDKIVFGPDDVDLRQSPMRACLDRLGVETFVLGAFNPGLTKLPNGNLLLMARIAESLKDPIRNGFAHAIRRAPSGEYVLDAYAAETVDLRDPRTFQLKTHSYKSVALTSLSWLLPVEVSGDGLDVIHVHYDKTIAPEASYQEYGVEDARISLVDGVYFMTACAVSAERHGACVYTSRDGLNYKLEGLVLDHQNKDMLYFEGKIGGKYWALTRPLGDLYFLYPPDSPYHAGPAIHLATSPDGFHWRPHDAPFLRPRKDSLSTMKIGGGSPPILTPRGWLMLYHGVAPLGFVGIYRTFWALLSRDDPSKIIHVEEVEPLLEARPGLTTSMSSKIYLTNVVFTTGIADMGEHYVVASGELDLACRITHIPKSVFL